jgi:hypothetical protein
VLDAREHEGLYARPRSNTLPRTPARTAHALIRAVLGNISGSDGRVETETGGGVVFVGGGGVGGGGGATTWTSLASSSSPDTPLAVEPRSRHESGPTDRQGGRVLSRSWNRTEWFAYLCRLAA